MTLLEQASALLAEDGPFTLAQAKALDALCEQAEGEEADLLGISGLPPWLRPMRRPCTL